MRFSLFLIRVRRVPGDRAHVARYAAPMQHVLLTLAPARLLGGACGGRLVALATALTPLTSLPDTLTNAYKVAFCVRA